jgi:alkylhydroperoxidase/carboxymuconolactone decarboxylase family protein YurZ
MQLFAQEAPEVAETFRGLIDAVAASPGLDEKTKHLIYIALKAAAGDVTPVRFHVPMAKALGATRDEVRDAVLLTLTVAGLRGGVSCLPVALEAFDGAPDA